MTPSRIEPATFRIVARCPNQLRQRVGQNDPSLKWISHCDKQKLGQRMEIMSFNEKKKIYKIVLQGK
jgi:hypothetical protein